MKDEEKKVNEEVQTEEEGVQLTDEELAQVNAAGSELTDPPALPATTLV